MNVVGGTGWRDVASLSVGKYFHLGETSSESGNARKEIWISKEASIIVGESKI